MRVLTASLTSPRARRWMAAALLTCVSGLSLAQTQTPPDDGNTAGDPPARIARLSYREGDVSLLPSGEQNWGDASLNRPLTTGDRLASGDNGRAELQLDSGTLRIADDSNVGFLTLNDQLTQLELTQGTANLTVNNLGDGQGYEIDTPTVALVINQPGTYRVDISEDGKSTRVTDFDGRATVYGEGGAQRMVAAGRSYEFADSSLNEVSINDIQGGDDFDAWCNSRNQRYAAAPSDQQYVSPDVVGAQDLDQYGNWQSDPDYGQVWYPTNVAADWSPYSDGYWSYVGPWGWTWVDAAPWGFAPYHYGRWAYVDDSWAWVPGPVVVSEPPVYAPALVAFVGGGGGGVDWGVSLAIGGAVAAGVAWFPLGPGEPWHPHWGDHDHWSPGYYNRVNNTTVVNNYNRNVTNVNVTNIHNTYINYRAPGGVTAVPATAFVHGQSVGRFAQKVDPQQWRNARINPGGPGIAPVKESFGPGLRNANYRPPAGAMARPVVATRSPAVPAAYHDSLAQRFAQSGGRVPGAGAPIVRTSVPAHMAGGPGAMPVQNVRVVQSHIAGRTPGAAPGAPGVPGAPNGMQQAGQRPGEAPVNGQPQRGGEPQARPGMPPQMANMHQQPTEAAHPSNGVPRPPQANGANPNAFAQQHGAPMQAGQQPGAEGRHEPAWTQPHTPMAQQAQQHGAPQEQARQPEARPGPQQQVQRQPEAQPPRAPEVHAQPQAPQPQQMQQAQQQPRQEYRPQPQQVQQPRPEPQPQQVQQPRPEPRPQPQQVQQPRPEPRPQPQQVQQPRPEPRPQQAQQPRPQPQPQHADQHSSGGNRDEHHKG